MKKLMFTRGRLLGSLGFVVITALLFAGCAGKFTGGGKLPSRDLMPGHYASFGFTYEITQSDGSGRLSGSYHDSYYGGVKFSFDGLEMGLGSCATLPLPPGTCAVLDTGLGVSSDQCLFGDGRYRSTNPAFSGGGDVEIQGCDRGEPGPSNGDSIAVQLTGGPYGGYLNGGPTTNGNLQAH